MGVVEKFPITNLQFALDDLQTKRLLPNSMKTKSSGFEGTLPTTPSASPLPPPSKQTPTLPSPEPIDTMPAPAKTSMFEDLQAADKILVSSELTEGPSGGGALFPGQGH